MVWSGWNQAAIKGFQKQYTSHKIRGENMSRKDETWQRDLKGCLPPADPAASLY